MPIPQLGKSRGTRRIGEQFSQRLPAPGRCRTEKTGRRDGGEFPARPARHKTQLTCLGRGKPPALTILLPSGVTGIAWWWTGSSEETTIRLLCLRFRGSHVPAVIRTEKLTKFYGSHSGIVEVDLAVEKGEVFGFLGPNGAGKTTTIRLLLDLIRPSSGKAYVFDI